MVSIYNQMNILTYVTPLLLQLYHFCTYATLVAVPLLTSYLQLRQTRSYATYAILAVTPLTLYLRLRHLRYTRS